jgi:hypothetical protein
MQKLVVSQYEAAGETSAAVSSAAAEKLSRIFMAGTSMTRKWPESPAS